MTLRDISIVLSPRTPEWPGDTPFDCRWTWKMSEGASVNVSAISGSPHVGTHADAPLHVRDGWAGADALPLDAFIGPALVVDLTGHQGAIEWRDLAQWTARVSARLLLRTGCSIAGGHFPERWPWLAPECVDTLLAGGLRLLGVDCPSVDDRESKSLVVHHRLFAGGASILENLDLSNVPSGEFELLAQPLAIEGLDAAPVRAVLRSLPVT